MTSTISDRPARFPAELEGGQFTASVVANGSFAGMQAVVLVGPPKNPF
ncbi:MAG: hypothetical protein ACJ765_10870 [Chloroflexota bacterium]